MGGADALPGAGASWLVAQFPAPLKALYSAVFRASALLSIELWTLKLTASER